MSFAPAPRKYVIWSIFIGVALIMLGRLFYIQIIEDKYKVLADDIAIYRKVVYPPRGVIYDKKGKVMLYNKVVYDLMVTANNVPKDIDTMMLSSILEIDTAEYKRLFHRAAVRNGPLRKSVMMEQLSQEQTARFQENMYDFPGFELNERYIRTYPDSSAAHVLGYIGEISKSQLKSDRYLSYRQGDYIGISGLEYYYEEVLRGQRGIYFLERDNFNRPTDPYKKGALDTPAVAGRSLELHLDAELQGYGERLMNNKIGSIVAIDPKTGGILAMVSTPTYSPNMLSGRNRTKNFGKLYVDARHPLLNRAIRGFYQPGSTMKPLTALVALDAGVITPSFGYPCAGGYYQCGKRVGCTHSGGGHAANLRLALANSCNAYFVHIFRKMVDAEKFGGIRKGIEKWYEYNYDFGLGHPTGVDLPFELGGLLPDSNTYNRMYTGKWNSCNVMFVGMGQGEVALTPIQLANAMCIIANKGYYYTPHFVKSIAGKKNDTSLVKYHQKHVVTKIPDEVYSIVKDGMSDVVKHGTGRVAALPDIEVCAKTGTVENKALISGKVVQMKDHSVFVAFAPKENPKIAIAVIVENAGFGATWAGPVASLMIEKYLTDSVATNRKYLEDRLTGANLISPYVYIIDKEQKYRDSVREVRRLERISYLDSTKRVEDSILVNKWLKHTYGK
ncbi:MAG: penicillin-binding protein 2 [Chitinophagaceae bacterium]|nr:penicillin-binding protein 2 [Chitinophagaceae bacterium]